MPKNEEKTTTENEPVETKRTSTGRVYNFTRHGFIVEANSLVEAQEALEVHLKEKSKEEAK
jgi:hypothetical protein